MTTVKDFRLGADPEFFLADKAGKFVSAYGLIPGTKDNPLPVKLGAVQVDGMALEFNIEPAVNRDDFNINIMLVLDQLRKMIDGDLTFKYVPVAHFGNDYIEAQHEDAKKLGCTPDFNAYTGEANPMPDASFPFRTASGHIHIGWTENMDINDPEHIEACRMMVKQLDASLGLASVLWDPDTTRRSLYGKAGAFRPKHYGVEYRVMSNAWLNSNDLRVYIFNTARAAFQNLLKGNDYLRHVSEDDIQKAINSSDWKAAFHTLSNTVGASPLIIAYYNKLWEETKPARVRDELGRWKKVTK